MNRNQPSEANEQSGSPFNPDHYPPGRLPALTTAELEAITQRVGPGQRPTKEELNAALSEGRRAVDKIEWMNATERSDKKERVSSATATMRANFSLDTLTVIGRDHCEGQTRKAKRPRPRKDPLNAAILSVSRRNPDSSAREIWDALLSYQDAAGGDVKFFEEDGLLKWEYWVDGEQEKRHGHIAFGAFEKRVSRLKKRRR